MTGRARAAGEGSIFSCRNGFAAYSWVRTPAGKRRRSGSTARRARRSTTSGSRSRLSRRTPRSLAESRRSPNTCTTWHRSPIRPTRPSSASTSSRTSVRSGWTAFSNVRFKAVNSVARTCHCCAQNKDKNRPVARQRCCALGSCCKTMVSPRTLSDIRGCLRSALGQAVTEELITRNVAAAVKLPNVRSRSNRRKASTTDEARRFLESARADQDPLYAAYVLVLGLRKGEVLGLTRTHVDLDESELQIALQLHRVSRELLHR